MLRPLSFLALLLTVLVGLPWVAQAKPKLPEAVAPLVDASRDCTSLVLDASWSHFDPLLAPKAPTEVFDPIERWLERHRRSCWESTGF